MLRCVTSELLVATKCFCFALAILLPAEVYAFQVELPKQVNRALVQPDVEHRLVVKFNDALRARCVDGEVVSADENANRFVSDLSAANNLQFHPLINLDEAKLEALAKKAAVNSGRKQPDLCAMVVVEAAKAKLQQVALTLSDSQYVEWVEFERIAPAPPVFFGDFDIAPPTPDYAAQNRQGYVGPNPGLNTLAFQAFGNSRGQGVRIADCEYGFHPGHEDLCDIVAESGQTPNPQVASLGFDAHGTASLGISVGANNGYGVRGISYDADAFFFSEWTNEGGFRRAAAIASAIATVEPGDIVLLEMQTSIAGEDAFGPAELSNSVWNVVRMASDLGVIVVAAAGNGDQDLDSGTYASYRARGDSGSIIVGAGTPNTSHSKLGFSTFGSRVNVQGWGRSVFTLGYGGFSQIGGSDDLNQYYTSTFAGTSSASAMLAGVCAALQGYAKAELGRPLTPAEMREVLTETGLPQGTGGNIGRFPDMVEAATFIRSFEPDFLLGDVNRDESVDFLDIPPFIGLLAGSINQIEADIDRDGKVDFLDIAPFISLLAQGGSAN